MLHAAVSAGRLQLVRNLLDRGAEVDRRNAKGQRPVHLALFSGMDKPPHTEIAGLLLEHGAAYDIWIASALGDVDEVRRMLSEDAGLANFKTGATFHPGGATYPLLMAARSGHRAVVELLLEHGADPDGAIVMHYNETVLHRVASVGGLNPLTDEERVAFARQLLDCGADIHAMDDEMKATPLGWAARCRNPEKRAGIE